MGGNHGIDVARTFLYMKSRQTCNPITMKEHTQLASQKAAALLYTPHYQWVNTTRHMVQECKTTAVKGLLCYMPNVSLHIRCDPLSSNRKGGLHGIHPHDRYNSTLSITHAYKKVQEIRTWMYTPLFNKKMAVFFHGPS